MKKNNRNYSAQAGRVKKIAVAALAGVMTASLSIGAIAAPSGMGMGQMGAGSGNPDSAAAIGGQMTGPGGSGPAGSFTGGPGQP